MDQWRPQSIKFIIVNRLRTEQPVQNNYLYTRLLGWIAAFPPASRVIMIYS